MRTSHLITTLAATVTLGACMQTPQANSDALTPKQQALLAKHLEGKQAGDAVNCIPSSNTDQMVRVSDSILLYRVSSRLVYRNDLVGSCRGLARDNDIVVTNQFMGRPCDGDLIRLVDRTSGMPGGACSLGKFVPYRTPSSSQQ